MATKSSAKILYVFDPLCGWCYGFGPVMEQFYHKHKNEVAFEAIGGGMITGEREGPIGVVAPYIKRAYKDVEQATGVRFGEDFLTGTLEEGTAYFTSVPPCTALEAFKSVTGSDGVLFGGDLLKAIYHDGIAPTDISKYTAYATDRGANKQAFEAAMKQPDIQQITRNQFKLSSRLGVTGFPTVLLQQKDAIQPLVHGYTSLERFEQQFQAAMR